MPPPKLARAPLKCSVCAFEIVLEVHSVARLLLSLSDDCPTASRDLLKFESSTVVVQNAVHFLPHAVHLLKK